MATVAEQLKALESKLPKWVRENRTPTERELTHTTNEQLAILAEYERLLKLYKDPNQRDAWNVANIGMQAQGKSTFTRQQVDKYVAALQQRGIKRKVLIYLPNVDRNYADLPEIDGVKLIQSAMLPAGHPQKWVDGPRIWYGKNHKKNIKVIATYLTNALCVYEEANEWMLISGSAPEWQLVPFSQSRHRAVDNIICLHRLMDIPHRIRGFFKGFNLFKSDDHPSSEKWFYENGFSGDPKQFLAAFNRVRNAPHDPSSKIQYCEYFDARLGIEEKIL